MGIWEGDKKAVHGVQSGDPGGGGGISYTQGGLAQKCFGILISCSIELLNMQFFPGYK